MASLKVLKGRIKSIKSTQKITKAMQLISAARMHKAKEALLTSSAYSLHMKQLMDVVTGDKAGNVSKIDSKGVHLFLVITSDRGLCGSFNTAIVKQARQHVLGLQSSGQDFYILCLGKRGYESLSGLFGVEKVSRLPSHKIPTLRDAEVTASRILEDYRQKRFQHCSVLFSKFVSVIKSNVVREDVVVSIDICKENRCEFEPQLENIESDIIERYLVSRIYSVCLEGAASEHGARMTAMDNATRSAKEMLQKLSHQYNRTRQSLITKELIEIISGAGSIE